MTTLPAAHDDAQSVIVIAGPTASGKSALTQRVAERVGGTIINADSMQVYRELRVLTARPTSDDEARIPHRLYGVLSAQEPCSAGRWCAWAHEAIATALADGNRPIVVGGSGLYLRALIDGIAPIPAIPGRTRAEAQARYASMGASAFHAELAELDPAAGARLHPCDRQRVTRAWEVLRATSRPLNEWQAETHASAPPMRFSLVVVSPPRSELYRQCDDRFRRMVDGGALDEVHALRAQGLDPALPAMRAVGVRELARHIEGDIKLDRAIQLAQQATRQLAKRQTTWLRHQWPKCASGNIASSTWIYAQYSIKFKHEILNNIT